MPRGKASKKKTEVVTEDQTVDAKVPLKPKGRVKVPTNTESKSDNHEPEPKAVVKKVRNKVEKVESAKETQVVAKAKGRPAKKASNGHSEPSDALNGVEPKKTSRANKKANVVEEDTPNLEKKQEAKVAAKPKAVGKKPKTQVEEATVSVKETEVVTKVKGRAGKKAANGHSEQLDAQNGDANKKSRAKKKLEPDMVSEKHNGEKATVQQTEVKVAKKRGRQPKQKDEAEIIADPSPKKKSKFEASPIDNEKAENDLQPSTSKESVSDVKKTKSRKREAKTDAETTEENAVEGSQSKKPKKVLMNSTETTYNKADFELLIPAADGNSSNASNSGSEHQRSVLKISSWNVAGLRSWLKKDGLKYIEYEEPDIFCMQETKCTNDQLPEEVTRIPGYHPYWLCLKGGYAGVALYSKIMPINVEYGIGNNEFDVDGRLITAEYEKFYLVNVYVPNSGRKLVNLEARMRWEKLFQAYIKKLDAFKPVVITGDMNVSHHEIDLANPKANTRSAGFTIEEREKMTELLALGFIDTYRHLYPDKRGAYTYWTYMANARSRNIGWRLDYFIVSERILKRVIENAIRSQCMGSDHCPITLFINI